MRKVFLDDLPKTYKGIDWEKCIGATVRFIYDDITGILTITQYDKSYLKVKYKENTFNIRSTGFINCNLGALIGIYHTDYMYDIGDVIDSVTYGKLLVLEKIMIKSNKWSNRGYKYQCQI